jgi:hypothetical protein
VAASENLNASGLVLISDLEVEVQEDQVSGRVRANVTSEGGTPVADADVRVIGQNNAVFISGETDRRGVFVADGISGAATVLVRTGDQFAFHRGTQALLQVQLGVPLTLAGVGEDLYSNLKATNDGTLASQSAMLNEITRQEQRGVDIYRMVR